jgi:hypothetical protein
MKKKYYIYLIYLSVVTLVVTVVSVSRYNSTVEGGGSAVVAVPVIAYIPVSATFNGDPLTDITDGGLDISGFQPGDELVYNFNVSNYDGTRQNQVLLKYDISVSFDPDPQVHRQRYTNLRGNGHIWALTGMRHTAIPLQFYGMIINTTHRI